MRDLLADFTATVNKMNILRSIQIPEVIDWDKVEDLLYSSAIGSEMETLGITIVNELYRKYGN